MKKTLYSIAVSVGLGLVFAFSLFAISKTLNYTIDNELIAISAAMTTGLVSGLRRRTLRLKAN